MRPVKPIFHLAILFARREAKTRIRQCDWLKLVGEKIRCEQVGTVPTFLSVPANKVAKWKIGFRVEQFCPKEPSSTTMQFGHLCAFHNSCYHFANAIGVIINKYK